MYLWFYKIVCLCARRRKRLYVSFTVLGKTPMTSFSHVSWPFLLVNCPFMNITPFYYWCDQHLILIHQLSFAVVEMNPGPCPGHASAISLSSTHVVLKWNHSHKEKRWKCKQSLASWLVSILFFRSLLIQKKAKSHAPRLTCPSSFDRSIRILNLEQLTGAACEAFCGDSSPLQTYF